VVDRGREQGVKVGTTFEVYSGSTYKGRVEVTDVKPSTCVGKVILESHSMSPGDSATTDL